MHCVLYYSTIVTMIVKLFEKLKKLQFTKKFVKKIMLFSIAHFD